MAGWMFESSPVHQTSFPISVIPLTSMADADGPAATRLICHDIPQILSKFGPGNSWSLPQPPLSERV